jgi:hypothetical protein
MAGEGEIARTIAKLFAVHARKYGLEERWCGLSTKLFVREQLDIFRSRDDS